MEVKYERRSRLKFWRSPTKYFIITLHAKAKCPSKWNCQAEFDLRTQSGPNVTVTLMNYTHVFHSEGPKFCKSLV